MTGKIRKFHGSTLKAKVALAASRGDLTVAQICSEYGVAQTQVFNWKKQLLDGAAQIFEQGTSPARSEEAISDPLYKEIGRLQVENAFLKKKCSF
jgi:transposase-like protein